MTKKKNKAMQKNDKLRHELELLRRGPAISAEGVGFLYVVLIGLVGILFGYYMTGL